VRYRPLHDGEELDRICWDEYGELPGSVEAVLRANWDRLDLFDNLGRITPLAFPTTIFLPDLARPTDTTQSVRIFD
jgi:phage tail protein X